MAAKQRLTGTDGERRLPSGIETYIRHVGQGKSIRAIAREYGIHPSTIMRQVHKIESRREDPLVDLAVTALERKAQAGEGPARPGGTVVSLEQEREREFRQEARAALLAMQHRECCLAVVPSLEKSVVVRTLPSGETEQVLVVDRQTAEKMALREWIAVQPGNGRVLRYHVTAVGRAALKRMVAEIENERAGLGEDNIYAAQHQSLETREIGEPGKRRSVRYDAAESPVASLLKLRKTDGTHFLTVQQYDAAERIREDFELAQMRPRITQDWGKFMTAGVRAAHNPTAQVTGVDSSRERVAQALHELGPGLGDIVLRCCCFLEGLEQAERSLGWSARSAKVVLRIALERLHHFYARGSFLVG